MEMPDAFSCRPELPGVSDEVGMERGLSLILKQETNHSQYIWL